MSENHSTEVKNHFQENWAQYDQKIRKVIPFYDEGFQIMIDIVRGIRLVPQSVLDIGIGTGNLSLALLKTLNCIKLTGIDIVSDYVKMAGHKLSNFKDQIDLHCLDVNEYSFDKKHDLVISSFVFHHITDDDKRAMYQKIYHALNPGGMFINYDFVGSGSSLFYKVFDDIRMDYMRKNGISEEIIQIDYIDHRNFEIPMSYHEQRELLSSIGFKEVECFWKYINLAIFGGIKK